MRPGEYVLKEYQLLNVVDGVQRTVKVQVTNMNGIQFLNDQGSLVNLHFLEDYYVVLTTTTTSTSTTSTSTTTSTTTTSTTTTTAG